MRKSVEFDLIVLAKILVKPDTVGNPNGLVGQHVYFV